MPPDQFAQLIGPVARALLGEPNRQHSSVHELRYGTNGSLAIDLVKGVWHDHEANEGGGLFELVARAVGCHINEAPAWLKDHGFELKDDYQRKNNGQNRAGAKPQRRIDKVFPYTDLYGQKQFEVVRYDPKDFRQRRSAGNGSYIWNLQGIKLVPYRLPEFTEAIAIGHTVFIVEGEKCVDLLWSIGIPATCNPMGAGKWSDELNQYFVGADVVIIGDFDPQKKNRAGDLMCHDDGRPVLAGQDHALNVAERLSASAARVRVLDLALHWPQIKPKNDIADWFAAGGTAGMLHALAEHAVDWTPELTLLYPSPEPDILSVVDAFPIDGAALPVRPWEVPGLLLRKQVTVLVAPPGIGKSLLTLQISLMCANGFEWGGWWPRDSYKTLIINVEEDETEMRRRLFGAAKKMSIDQEKLIGKVFIAEATNIVVAKADSRTKTVVATPMLEKIVQTILAMQIDIVVVDPFAETFAGDENSNSELKWAAVLWREVARKTNCAVLLVHHAKKYAGHMAGDMDAARGGGSLVGVARVMSTLFTMTEGEYAQIADALREQAVKEKLENPVERSRLLRFDDAKVQYSMVSSSARWFCKESVGIGNSINDIPEDEVGVLMPWTPPKPIITTEILHDILDEIDVGVRDEDGQPTGNPYTRTRRGKTNDRWVGMLIKDKLDCSDSEAEYWIKFWCDEGLLTEYRAKIPVSKGALRACLKVNKAKRPDRPVANTAQD
jgi:KaiC/GvpD/RAD55 family RecA-like ATPase